MNNAIEAAAKEIHDLCVEQLPHSLPCVVSIEGILSRHFPPASEEWIERKPKYAHGLIRDGHDILKRDGFWVHWSRADPDDYHETEEAALAFLREVAGRGA